MRAEIAARPAPRRRQPTRRRGRTPVPRSSRSSRPSRRRLRARSEAPGGQARRRPPRLVLPHAPAPEASFCRPSLLTFSPRPGAPDRLIRSCIAGGCRMNGRGLLLTLAWLWPVLLIVYLVWGGIEQAGLYYWVGTLEVDRFGTYEPKLTGIVPGLLLALPALWILGGEARRRRLPPNDPARRLRAAAIVMICLGVLALAVAIACYVAAQGQPGGGRDVPFDASSLGNGPPPVGRVSLTGRVDESAQASVSESPRFSSATTTYAGFRPDGGAGKSGPFRIFVERRVSDHSGPVVRYLGDEESGYLVENGLPPLVLYALRHQGIPVATPHYLLRTGRSAMRDPYYVGAALSTLFFCLMTGIGTLLLILPKRGAAAARPTGG